MIRLLLALSVLLSGCSVVSSSLTLPDGNTLTVRSYSFFRSADASYEGKDLKIHYGAATEAAKAQDMLQMLLQAMMMAAKAGAGVPAP